MRPRRFALLAAASGLAVAAPLITTAAAHATGTVFGNGGAGFAISSAPTSIIGHDGAGEPSIGVSWRTGVGMFMDGFNVARLAFDNATGNVNWTDVSPASGLSVNIDPIMVTDPRTGVTLAGGDTGPCSAMWTTSNDGASWLPSVPCTVTFDHPTVGYAPSATLAPGSDVFYYCQQGPSVQHCATSTTNGTAWTPAGVAIAGASPIPALQCDGLHGHLRGSTDGTAYLPSKNCFNSSGNFNVGGVRTSNDGLTWSEYLIPGASSAGFDPAVVATPDNTVYEAWENAGNYHPLLAASHDHGATWSTPVDLAGTVPGLVASTFPTLVAGDNGRIAYSFLGSSVGSGNPNTTGFHGIWYLYTSYSYDGGATWTTVKDTPSPVQYGEIDNGGTTTSGQRNLLDFIDSSVTKDGRVVVGFANGCLSDCQAATSQAGAEALSTHAWASVAYQTVGKGLFAAYDVP